MWHVTCDMWQVTCDKWQLTILHIMSYVFGFLETPEVYSSALQVAFMVISWLVYGKRCRESINMLMYYPARSFRVIFKLCTSLDTSEDLHGIYGHLMAIYGQTGQDGKNVLSICSCSIQPGHQKPSWRSVPHLRSLKSWIAYIIYPYFGHLWPFYGCLLPY